MDICYLKNAELEPKLQKYKGRVVLRGDIVKDDSGACAVFTAQGSSALQMSGKYRIGNACSFIENKGYFCQFLWMTSKWLEEAEYGSHVEEIDEKNVDVEEPASLLDHENLGCTRT